MLDHGGRFCRGKGRKAGSELQRDRVDALTRLNARILEARVEVLVLNGHLSIFLRSAMDSGDELGVHHFTHDLLSVTTRFQ